MIDPFRRLVRGRRWLRALALAGLFSGPALAFAEETVSSGDHQARGETIMLPRCEFFDATVREALEFLDRKSVMLDPAGVGINLIVPPCLLDTGTARIRVNMKNATVRQVVEAVVREAGFTVRTEPNALIVQPENGKAPPWAWTDENDGAKQVEGKLHALVLPAMDFADVLAREALTRLCAEAKKLADKGQVPEIISRIEKATSASQKISLRLPRLPLYDVLRYVCLAGDLRMHVTKEGAEIFSGEESYSRQADAYARALREFIKDPAHKLQPGVPVERKAAPDVPWEEEPPVPLPALAEGGIRRFLQKHDSAKSYAAVVVVSGDKKWLAEGLAKFPEDPDLLLLSCERLEADSDRSEILARARRVTPNHLLPVLVEAHLAFREHHPDEAIKLLGDTLRNPAFRFELPMPNRELSELFSECGEAPPDLVWRVRDVVHRVPMLWSVRLAGDMGGGSVVAKKGDPPLSKEAIVCLLLLQRRIAALPAINAIEELVALALENKALEGMTNATAPPDLPKPPAVRLKEIADRRLRINHIQTLDFEWFDPAVMPDLAREALRRFDADGEVATLEWLATQRPKEKKRPARETLRVPSP